MLSLNLPRNILSNYEWCRRILLLTTSLLVNDVIDDIIAPYFCPCLAKCFPIISRLLRYYCLWYHRSFGGRQHEDTINGVISDKWWSADLGFPEIFFAIYIIDDVVIERGNGWQWRYHHSGIYWLRYRESDKKVMMSLLLHVNSIPWRHHLHLPKWFPIATSML